MVTYEHKFVVLTGFFTQNVILKISPGFNFASQQSHTFITKMAEILEIAKINPIKVVGYNQLGLFRLFTSFQVLVNHATALVIGVMERFVHQRQFIVMRKLMLHQPFRNPHYLLKLKTLTVRFTQGFLKPIQPLKHLFSLALISQSQTIFIWSFVNSFRILVMLRQLFLNPSEMIETLNCLNQTNLAHLTRRRKPKSKTSLYLYRHSRLVRKIVLFLEMSFLPPKRVLSVEVIELNQKHLSTFQLGRELPACIKMKTSNWLIRAYSLD